MKYDIRDLYAKRCLLMDDYLNALYNFIAMLKKKSLDGEYILVYDNTFMLKTLGEDFHNRKREIKTLKKIPSKVILRVVDDMNALEDENISNNEIYNRFIDEKVLVESYVESIGETIDKLSQRRLNADLKVKIADYTTDVKKLENMIKSNYECSQSIMLANLFEEGKKEKRKNGTMTQVKLNIKKQREKV